MSKSYPYPASSVLFLTVCVSVTSSEQAKQLADLLSLDDAMTLSGAVEKDLRSRIPSTSVVCLIGGLYPTEQVLIDEGRVENDLVVQTEVLYETFREQMPSVPCPTAIGIGSSTDVFASWFVGCEPTAANVFENEIVSYAVPVLVLDESAVMDKWEDGQDEVLECGDTVVEALCSAFGIPFEAMFSVGYVLNYDLPDVLATVQNHVWTTLSKAYAEGNVALPLWLHEDFAVLIKNRTIYIPFITPDAWVVTHSWMDRIALSQSYRQWCRQYRETVDAYDGHGVQYVVVRAIPEMLADMDKAVEIVDSLPRVDDLVVDTPLAPGTTRGRTKRIESTLYSHKKTGVLALVLLEIGEDDQVLRQTNIYPTRSSGVDKAFAIAAKISASSGVLHEKRMSNSFIVCPVCGGLSGKMPDGCRHCP